MRVLLGSGERHRRRLRVSGRRSLRDRGAGSRLLPARRGFPQHRQLGHRLRAARVRDLRRARRPPPAGAPARAEDARRHDAPHDPPRAERRPAARDAGADRPLDPSRRHGRARTADAGGDLRGAADQDRPHPARHSGHSVRRPELLQGSVRRRREDGAAHLRAPLPEQGHRARPERAAAHSRGVPRRRLHRRRSHPSERAARAGRSVPSRPRAPREEERGRERRHLLQPVRRARGAEGVHRSGGPLHHAVSQRGADHLGDAGIRLRLGKGRRLDAILARGGAARGRSRGARAVRRRGGPGTGGDRPAARRHPAARHAQERVQAGSRDGLEQHGSALLAHVRAGAPGGGGAVPQVLRDEDARPAASRSAGDEARASLADDGFDGHVPARDPHRAEFLRGLLHGRQCPGVHPRGAARRAGRGEGAREDSGHDLRGVPESRLRSRDRTLPQPPELRPPLAGCARLGGLPRSRALGPGPGGRTLSLPELPGHGRSALRRRPSPR